MNHKRYFVRFITLLLAILFLAGCAAPQSNLSATTAPQTCPTTEPQSCPTSKPLTCPTAPACPTSAAAQMSSTEEWWYSTITGSSEMDITFEPGDKCTVNTSFFKEGRTVLYNIKVNDQTHALYLVLFQTLDEGKTLEDLQAFPKTSPDAPSWVHVFRENYVGPVSNSFNREDFPEGPIYISCFVLSETGILRILDYGPVEIE